MKRIKKYTILLVMLLALASGQGVIAAPAATIDKPAVKQQSVVQNSNISSQDAIQVTPLAVVANPNMFLNKTIIMTAKFDKFSTIGLDYPPALRKTEDYISFMVYRDDTQHDIPLSELKLFMKRTDAQKFIDLKSKDKVKITGKLFSTALGDAWVDVIVLENIK